MGSSVSRLLAVAGVLVLMALGAAAIWWLFFDSREPLSTERIMEDVCTQKFLHYDGTVRVHTEDEVMEWATFEYSNVGYRLSWLLGDSYAKEETIVIFDTPISLFSDAERAAGQAEGAAAVPRLVEAGQTWYSRELDDSGQWSPWKASSESMSKVEGIDKFCGRVLGDLRDLQMGGKETINGIATTKYSGNIEGDNDPTRVGPHDSRMEYWVDTDGRLVRHRIVRLASGVIIEYDYYGWGEINNISAALTPTPNPTPTATAEPTPTTEPMLITFEPTLLRVRINAGDTQPWVGEQVTPRAVVSGRLGNERGSELH